MAKEAPRKFKRLKELLKHKGRGVLDIFLKFCNKIIPGYVSLPSIAMKHDFHTGPVKSRIGTI